MNIYSIEEIIKASNDLLIPKIKTENLIPPETEKIIRQAEKNLIKQKKNNQNIEEPLILRNEVLDDRKDGANSFNYKIKIKAEIKDRMINELYIFLKKKIKKNTLKLIIDEQLEIKNLKGKINFLEKNKNVLIENYQILNKNYKISLENYKQLIISKEQLSIEKKELIIDNKKLQNNLNQVSQSNEELKIKLQKIKIDLEESLQINRSLVINNTELKNTISRYINNSKKTQEKINLLEKSKNSEFEDETKKVKFYQDENIRLSSELMLAKEKNEIIKSNLDNIQTEKEKISGKIKELNASVERKTNIISTPFIKDNSEKIKKDVDILNDKEQKSLDEVISRIFAKI
tara:strand:+ start:800 stop:1837 length:1038 start_codon:yes stop_codon:yes gene_type:complete